MRRLLVLTAAATAVLAVPGTASAHHLVVTPPGGGEGTTHWVGGGPLPENARGAALIPSPIGLLPPSHATGLVQACLATRQNPSAASFVPPGPGGPADADCRHGPP